MTQFLASLVILALAAPTFSQSSSDTQGRPQAKRCWLDPEYRRDVAEYEKERDTLQQVRALDIVGVKPGMVVGEVGAGVGYFTLKIAERVGPTGTVYANDIVEDFLAVLRDRAKERGFSNIQTRLGTETDPRLPAGKMDFVFLVQVFWHLSKPVEVLDRIAASLKPGAKLVVVENERGKSLHGNRLVEHTRQNILEIIAGNRLRVERVDTSLPDPASVVFVLVLK
jgi:ubiquinone/menaquinone biosynthesis C-methylase UbiE